MKKLRSFVYLDNYKMYSFFSIIWEGLTYYIVKIWNNKYQRRGEKQKDQLEAVSFGQYRRY
jgi:hypothetical protein